MRPTKLSRRRANHVIRCQQMPEISRFFGIVIRMYFDDHNPPHFHAIYADGEAQIGIDPVAILNGSLSGRATSLVVEWAALHQSELMQNWKRLQEGQSTQNISPFKYSN